jgi:hypothetical protein
LSFAEPRFLLAHKGQLSIQSAKARDFCTSVISVWGSGASPCGRIEEGNKAARRFSVAANQPVKARRALLRAWRSGTTFKGLLTENGITRWLAHHVTKTLSIVDLEDVSVRDVVPEEEKRENWAFVSREEAIDAVRGLFIDKKLLEAVLITHSGSHRESPLGLVTRWDIIR